MCHACYDVIQVNVDNLTMNGTCHSLCHVTLTLASFPGRVGKTAKQLSRVQTVYGCNVMAIAHSSSDVHVILLIKLPPAENGPFLLVESNCLRRFCDGRQAEDEQTKKIVQSTHTSAIEQSTIVMNGRDCDISTRHAIWFTVTAI